MYLQISLSLTMNSWSNQHLCFSKSAFKTCQFICDTMSSQIFASVCWDLLIILGVPFTELKERGNFSFCLTLWSEHQPKAGADYTGDAQAKTIPTTIALPTSNFGKTGCELTWRVKKEKVVKIQKSNTEGLKSCANSMKKMEHLLHLDSYKPCSTVQTRTFFPSLFLLGFITRISPIWPPTIL